MISNFSLNKTNDVDAGEMFQKDGATITLPLKPSKQNLMVVLIRGEVMWIGRLDHVTRRR